MQTLAHLFGQLKINDASARLIVGVLGNIRYVDDKVESLLGYECGELVDRPLSVLIPERFRRVHVALRNEFAGDPAERHPRGRVFPALRKDGTELELEIGLVPVKTDAGTFTMVALQRVPSAQLMGEDPPRTVQGEERGVMLSDARAAMSSIDSMARFCSSRGSPSSH